MLDHVHPYQFRRNSPFYPLVTNYVVLLAGFKEFAAAGIALTLKDLPDTEAEKALSGAENKGNAHIVRRLMDANPSELYEPLELMSEQSATLSQCGGARWTVSLSPR